MSRKLYRNTDNKMIAGVCSGFSEYLDIDVTIMRIIFILIPGINLLVYLLLALIIPAKEDYNVL